MAEKKVSFVVFDEKKMKLGDSSYTVAGVSPYSNLPLTVSVIVPDGVGSSAPGVHSVRTECLRSLLKDFSELITESRGFATISMRRTFSLDVEGSGIYQVLLIAPKDYTVSFLNFRTLKESVLKHVREFDSILSGK